MNKVYDMRWCQICHIMENMGVGHFALILARSAATLQPSEWFTSSVKINVIHYSDAIMGAMASQISSLVIVYSTIYSCTDQRKHQSSASLAFVRGIHRWPVNSPHKGPVTRKMIPFDDGIMEPIQNVFCFVFIPHLWSKFIDLIHSKWPRKSAICSRRSPKFKPLPSPFLYLQPRN